MSQALIKLLTITDIPDSAAYLRTVAEQADDMQISGESVTAQDAVSMAKSLQPDVVIMDYDMPGLNGAEITRTILADNPSTQVIMLSVVNDAEDIRHAMRAGARDYLVKPLGAGELLETIRWLIRERREYARMQAFVGQMRKAYEALFKDDKPIPDNVVAYLETQAEQNPNDRLAQETLAVAYARNRDWVKLAPLVNRLAAE
jgi:DNA-binding NarL/FixJ family response regulator